ncbi:VP39 [Perigonia lusca single nucleopolyhedrovirus]|uniref:VP39 n=1 Tax=Perigonia lusca single nucleopolyhedrovirus TaxID=1675865 RepID=A0A0M3WPB5_9ABAC|nr:VP39 [Perigonia lusca single nucleopolyhedrovirus]AKN80657.1 VP39 [Perigonia lusca single nucleopolyhedrovirus]
MALVLGGTTNSRLNNYCVFGAAQPFDSCYRYGTPCSPDAKNNDGWLICEYHLSARFKMEKMVLPIPDAEGNTYYRSVGKSLVSHKAQGNQRVLVPTKENYQTVLNIMGLSLAEQYIMHIIYENNEHRDQICQLLEVNERYEVETYKIIEQIDQHTNMVIGAVTPNKYCHRLQNNGERIWVSNDNPTRVAVGQIFEDQPPFVKNLIEKAAAPETIQFQDEILMLRNCHTCTFGKEGLVASVTLYNPVEPRYRNSSAENVLQVERVLKFKGNDNALQRSLNRYEPYPIVVPVIVGTQIITPMSSVPRRRIAIVDTTTVPTTPARPSATEMVTDNMAQ